jgi:hypothetical protein
MREDEYSHKGIDRTAQIDRKYIESNEFRRKFDNATSNSAVNKTLYDSAKEMLYDRSGTHYESMYWIDGDTGKVIVKFDSMGKTENLRGESHELKVEYRESLLKKLTAYKNIITIHNHPNSTAPSSEDLNSAFIHHYTIGYTVSHNGCLYKYTANELIDIELYDQYVGAYIYQNPYADVVNAQLEAYRKLSYNLNISVIEVTV